ncbi:MAG TPA: multifunctional oxoglutarate decarboxylase/oxoglutarate dehydrogenase thiamine pyrophosphate-binding subunit/dihydrolipoyllysine-residue succinyltransferase subunit [Blastocatellia bacterium]|nr:multifunctional oxoglutarate decarboxylase/oxoglutarate dehydrogenase thiamine pyrophosphate-binding subunit/dihydrolipoyllysine-residue succinyltransferase subunit [Blastocatellia bacterium]
MARRQKEPDLTQIIDAEFGSNASYVAELLSQFQANPALVDEEWREYFERLIDSDGASRKAKRETNGGGAAKTEPVASAPAPVQTRPAPKAEISLEGDKVPIRGGALKIAENMEQSLAVPTATSQRHIPLKVAEENRRLINEQLQHDGKRKASYTHLIAWAIIKALQKFPQLNDGYEAIDGSAFRVKRSEVNLGLAIDLTKSDGSRTLLVPNIKGANHLTFSQLLAAYDDIVFRARDGKIQVSDFQGTTISLTNPGTIGTNASNPRLMSGQGLIIATGAIEYPAEYQAMSPEALSQLGISKVMTITSTYDHRIVQGAESGAFLALISDYLLGKHDFYDEIFADLKIPFKPLRWAVDRNPALLGGDRWQEEIKKQARVIELINAYRVRGHMIADIDPLRATAIQQHPELDIEYYGLTIWDLDREFITGGLGRVEKATLRDILAKLRQAYCGTIAIEYRNISSPAEKDWLRDRIEEPRPEIPVEVRKRILWKLISAELFEKFLGTKYLGQKRFSVEGTETTVALLDQLVEHAAEREIKDITIGMSHRGRLNVIANVIGHFCERIFTSFEGSVHPNFPSDQGDVKYHQGASGERETEYGNIALSVAFNPSHLEFVDPVVEGLVRAKQDTLFGGRANGANDRAMPILLHGDAAFSGQGVVAETLNFSQLKGYRVGGTIHIIVNNQIGFTTPAEQLRSSLYSTDVAKMIQVPIFHVNADDPEAAYHVMRIALDYRMKFHKDVVIDLIGFRRHGHNEGDEPSYTQPVMYQRIREHPGVRMLYGQKLVKEGVYTQEEFDALNDERNRRYENAYLGAKEIVSRRQPITIPPVIQEKAETETVETDVDQGTLQTIASAVTTVPKGFHLNPKVVGLLARRAKMATGEVPVDWAFAEALAFGALLLEGTPVRLTGEDSSRGTFSQRHMVLFDTQTDQPWTPLAEMRSDQARLEIFDSSLSEQGVLGFEYGYSVAAPKTLTLWEAQFGDFVNVAQVIVDQFIAAGEEKWNQKSRLVMLLPHGYEGQGPEHSSARLERFLQLSAEDNMQVVYCSTPAQYFHVLRRQIKQTPSKPLVMMTPKSLLRHPHAVSPIDEFTSGGFNPIIEDSIVKDPSQIERVLICSGKVYYDLDAKRQELKDTGTAIVRLEQFYPFPKNMMERYLKTFTSAKDFRWVQEEAKNMGGWTFVRPRIDEVLPEGYTVRYVGRARSASPATGVYAIHQMEQHQLVNEAFA